MKNTYITFMSLLSIVFVACTNLPEPDEMGRLGTNIAYIEELNGTAQMRFTVGDDGGNAEFTGRVSNPSQEKVSFDIVVDKDIIEKYNAANKTSFSVLPEEVFDLELIDDSGKVISKGKSLNVTLAPKEYGRKIKIDVKTMILERKDDAGNIVKEPLPYYKNFVIPIRMTNVRGGAREQYTGTSGIVFLDRKFSMNVMHLNGALGLIYKENTLPQGPGKSYSGDKKYPEWTCQYSFRLDKVIENIGLMYPNTRTSRESPLYMTLYGGSLTLSAAGGKEKLNQPKFKDFIFKANKWYHMAISFKEEGGRPNLRLYINGELAYKSVWPKKVDEWPIIYLGNENFNGYVRELRFWSRALTQGEINETLWFANPDSEGLEVYLPLSENLKGSIKDKKDNWLNISSGAINFDDEFTFPTEEN